MLKKERLTAFPFQEHTAVQDSLHSHTLTVHFVREMKCKVVFFMCFQYKAYNRDGIRAKYVVVIELLLHSF